MPQPFKRRAHQVVKIAPDAILERPNFAVLIGLVAGYWSRLENVLSLPFVFLLSGEEPAALACYHSFFDLSLREKLFVSVAKTRGLSQKLIDESNAIHAKARKISHRRNDILYGIWAVCDSREDSILLCNPNNFDSTIFDTVKKHNEKRKLDVNATITEGTVNDFIEYSEGDFRDILDVIAKCTNEAQGYVTKIMDFSISRCKECP